MSPIEITALAGAAASTPTPGESVDASAFSDALNQTNSPQSQAPAQTPGRISGGRPTNAQLLAMLRRDPIGFLTGRVDLTGGPGGPLVRPEPDVGDPLVRPTPDGKAVAKTDGPLIQPGTPDGVPADGAAKTDAPLIQPDANAAAPGAVLDVALTLPGETALADGAALSAQAAVATAPEIVPLEPGKVETPAPAPAPSIPAAATAAPALDTGAAVAPEADTAKPADLVQKRETSPIEPATADPTPQAEARADTPPPATQTSAQTAAHVRTDAPLAHRLSFDAVAQLSAQILRKLEGKSTRFEMELHPADMGRIDVRLDIDDQGRLAARLAFDNPVAGADLRGRVDELRRQLEEAGFQLAQDAFSFADREGARDQSSDDGFGRRRSLIAAGIQQADAADLAAQPSLRASLRGGLDVRI